MSTRDTILRAGSEVFDEAGFDAATVAAVRERAGVSNGSFFHAFASKDALAAELFLAALTQYHDAMLAPLDAGPAATEGIAALVRAHLTWVATRRPQARILFERPRPEWVDLVRDRQRAENARFGRGIAAWHDPQVEAGHLVALTGEMFIAHLIGPAQIVCRAWLGGRSRRDPRRDAETLVTCAVRLLVTA